MIVDGLNSEALEQQWGCYFSTSAAGEANVLEDLVRTLGRNLKIVNGKLSAPSGDPYEAKYLHRNTSTLVIHSVVYTYNRKFQSMSS